MKSWDGGPPLSCTFSFMDILATLNRNYIPQLKVMLFSMRMSNPETDCTIYLMNQDIPQDELDTLSTWLSLIGYNLSAIQVDDSCFSDAVVTKQYPKEMYYRLIAPMLLPQSLDRILYLDPDILIINPLDKLWNLDIGDNLFAAAVHTDKKGTCCCDKQPEARYEDTILQFRRFADESPKMQRRDKNRGYLLIRQGTCIRACPARPGCAECALWRQDNGDR